MNTSHRVSPWRYSAWALIISFATQSSLAQTVTPDSNSANKEAPVELSVFKVTTNSISPYQGKDANSAGRIRAALIDTPQSVTVITRDFMDDIGTGRALDATKFSAGVTEAQFPNRLDRISIRGFQQDAAQQSQFVDGFRFTSISAGYNTDAANIERIEIVKGPNAIIAAAGSPGGSVNYVTKAPRFTAGGYYKVQLGDYLANRVEVDVTGPLAWKGGKFAAYRVVGMYTNSDGYQDNQFSKGYLIAPSITFAFNPATELTLKGFYWEGDVSAMNLPLDPRVGINDKPVVYPGLSDKFSSTGGHEPNLPGSQARLIAELTHKFSDNFQTRIGFMGGDLTSDSFVEAIRGNNLGNAVGNVNPTTGIYTPGTTWTVLNYGLPTQTVTSVAAAFPDFNNRSTGYTYNLDRGINRDRILAFQNDYVYEREFTGGRSTTVAGISANSHKYTSLGYATRTTPLIGSIDAPDYAASYANAAALLLLRTGLLNEKETTTQGYLAQVLHLFNDRLIASGSVSYFKYKQYITRDSIFTTNPLGTATPVAPNTGYVANAVYPTPPYDRITGNRTNVSYGVVFKPVKSVSLFYGRTENANPPTLNNIGGTSTAAQYGDQKEFGIKTSLRDGAVDISLTHFNLTQHNVFVYDVISNTYLPLGNVTSKGEELEVNARLTPEFTLIGSAANFQAREGFGRRLRSIPDRSGALAIKYQFTDGALKGLWLMLSGDYMSRRAGDIPGTININGASAAPGTVVGTVNGRTLTGIPVEPTFYLEARTIYNLTGGYTFNQHWKLWFKVDNLKDTKYIQAALNRGVLSPGTPRSLQASLTYKF